MPCGRQIDRPFRLGRLILAGLVLGLWMVLGLISSSPDLHHLLHKDSTGATHTCAVTQAAKDSLLPDHLEVQSLPPSPVLLYVCWAGPAIRLAGLDHSLPCSRGPPVPGSSSIVAG